MFGFSKDRKNTEVQVVMGLLHDNNGIPITYELFPDNTMDQSTLKKAVDNLKELYKLDKITIVADRGLNSGQNLEVKVALQPEEASAPKKRGRPRKHKIEQIPVNIHLT